MPGQDRGGTLATAVVAPASSATSKWRQRGGRLASTRSVTRSPVPSASTSPTSAFPLTRYAAGESDSVHVAATAVGAVSACRQPRTVIAMKPPRITDLTSTGSAECHERGRDWTAASARDGRRAETRCGGPRAGLRARRRAGRRRGNPLPDQHRRRRRVPGAGGAAARGGRQLRRRRQQRRPGGGTATGHRDRQHAGRADEDDRGARDHNHARSAPSGRRGRPVHPIPVSMVVLTRIHAGRRASTARRSASSAPGGSAGRRRVSRKRSARTRRSPAGTIRWKSCWPTPTSSASTVHSPPTLAT